jgi:hypothetical protein
VADHILPAVSNQQAGEEDASFQEGDNIQQADHQVDREVDKAV